MSIFEMMERKIAREGLTEANKRKLDVYLLGDRIDIEQYEVLMGIENRE